MISVCHVITDLNAGGAERMLVNLVTRLDRARFRNEVISLIEPGVMASELAAVGIPVINLAMRRGRPSISGMLALVRHLRRSRPAIIQSWLYHADLAATLASRAAPESALIWNIRCSDLPGQSEAGHLRWLVKLLARMSAWPQAVVCNSDAGRQYHEAVGYRPRQWVGIPNGVDTERFRPRPEARRRLRQEIGAGVDDPVIGYVARLHPMKDVPAFLRAARLFADSHPNCRFVACGDGFHRNGEVSALVAQAGLTDRVHLLGVRNDMEAVYPAFDVLALSSAYGEGFPNVLIEAMACGIPCVATDVGDSRAIVADTGLIFPPRDPEALARGWNMAMSPESQMMGQQARARAVDQFGIDRVCLLYETLYREISQQGHRGGVQTKTTMHVRN
ncbi:MAG: glycosyltransferase [Xanthobacteraceae bacterium]|nr:glycosyltransferase [Xanthobacteraceae bacterium]